MRSIDPVPSRITNYIYLGRYDHAMDTKLMYNLGVTDIISLVGQPTVKCPGVTYHVWSINDHHSQRIISIVYDIHEVLKSVRDKHGIALVCCQAGVSRSASAVIGHLILQGMEYAKAYGYVRKRRQWVNPNDGFVQQLQTIDVTNKMYQCPVQL